MTLVNGRNVNTNTEASLPPGVPLDAITSVIVAPANPNRIAFHVNNGDAVKGCWVKFQAAGVDNEKKGIFLNASGLSGSSWDMVPDNIYTGEISAIADSGTTTIHVTEY